MTIVCFLCNKRPAIRKKHATPCVRHGPVPIFVNGAKPIDRRGIAFKNRQPMATRKIGDFCSAPCGQKTGYSVSWFKVWSSILGTGLPRRVQRVEVVENLYQEQVSQVLTVKVFIRAKTVFMVFILTPWCDATNTVGCWHVGCPTWASPCAGYYPTESLQKVSWTSYVHLNYLYLFVRYPSSTRTRRGGSCL